MTHAALSSAFVLPGEVLDLDIVPAGGVEGIAVRASAGTVLHSGATRWSWRAPPTPGDYTLQVVRECGLDSLRLRAFVMVPATTMHGAYLNGYRIGRYPSTPVRRAATYRPPVGFVEVTPQNQDLFLTPHLQLRQFLTKQAGGFPKYVVLDPRLLQKLEVILDRVRQAGYARTGFIVRSGYRTPSYNEGLGNVAYSRHLYGAAADIFIDEHPKDGRMDDLNGDGRIDTRDAAVLYNLIDRQMADPSYRALRGGLAMYPGTSTHGPFVHVDVRGYAARW